MEGQSPNAVTVVRISNQDVPNSGSPTPAPTKRKVFIENIPLVGTEKEPDLLKKRREDRVMEVLLAWPNRDIWPFKVSCPLVGFAASVNGYILNKAMRGALLVGGHAFFSSYLATMGLPGVMAAGMHYVAVTRDILGQETGCSTCVQVRAACVQGLIGVMYPFFFTPIASLATASALKHFYFPKIHKDPMPTFRFVGETIATVKTPLLFASMAQIVIAMGVTYLQQDCFYSKILPVVNGEVKLTKESRKKTFAGEY